MYFSNFELYRGTVSTVKLILEQKDICELKIKMYKQLKEKNKNLSDKKGKLFDLMQQRKQKINKLESVIIDKIFKHDELKKLKISLEELDKIWDDLLLEIDINKYNIEQFLEDNCQTFDNYISISYSLNLIINRLGEKSLKELIRMLNINIPETSDNYFDEKSEMKTVLKKWFEIENKRIFNEIK